MTRLCSRFEAHRAAIGFACFILAACVLTTIMGLLGESGLTETAMGLATLGSALLLFGFIRRDGAKKATQRVELAVIHKISGVCAEISKGNFEARITNVTEGGQLAEVQHQVNDVIDRCGAFIRMQSAQLAVIHKIASVCAEISKGNFEARITNVTEGGQLAEVQHHVNDVIDRCDAFVREATASLEAVCGNIYYRRILLGGMQGTLRSAAEVINEAVNRQERAVEQARQDAAAEQARLIGLVAEGLTHLAQGKLTFRLGEFPEAYRQIGEDFNAAMARLEDTVSAITEAAREVTNASAEISTSTTDLSQRTEEQAASLEETSASMEQISATVKKNAESAQRANQSAAAARGIADRGSQVVARAVDGMSQIDAASRKIFDIIGVIDEIARQTNLLALNAAVEAARAGEAGRGFAVVASEVRSLAQRSSQAARDIKELITNSNNQVKAGVGLVNEAGSALSEILTAIQQVAAIVSEIALASGEQADGIEQVNKALTQMEQVTSQNSALVEENAATAKSLEVQSQEMTVRVKGFVVKDTAGTNLAQKPSEEEPASTFAQPRQKATPRPWASRGKAMQAGLAGERTGAKKRASAEF